MGIGNAIQRLIDPVDPRVTTWLGRELPRLVGDGVITPEQATVIARRYGLPDGSSQPSQQMPDAETGGASSGQPVEVPETAVDGAPSTAAPGVAQARPAGAPFLAEHAITIVLYLGAFLVVSAVATFLALSWGDLGGVTKLASLLLVDAGFLIVARLCLPRATVRPAGRTFLAIGALLVPADVAAAYAFLFADGPLPSAAFWLIGAVLAGGFYGLLSVRLASRAYGALATLALPVAGGSLASLARLDDSAVPLLAALSTGAAVIAARHRPELALAVATRATGCMLLATVSLAALIATFDATKSDVAGPLALVVAFAALALEATRSERSLRLTGVLALVLGPCIALAVGFGANRYPLVGAAVACMSIAAAIGIQPLRPGLPGRPGRLVWDSAALVLALLLPFAAWDRDGVSLALAFFATLVAAFVAWSRRSNLPLYAATLLATLAYVKLLALAGSPDNSVWRLGAALWPLGLIWVALGTARPRQCGGPSWLAALVTLVAATALTESQPGWQVAIGVSAALASLVVAWRSAVTPIVLLSVPWLLLVDDRLAGLAGLPSPYRLMALGIGAWLLVAVSCVARRPSINNDEPAGADRPDLKRLPGWTWATAARIGAVTVAAIGPLLLVERAGERDRWLEAAALAWLNLAAMLAVVAALTRSRDTGLAAALTFVPALLAGIGRLHPGDAQAYALPAGSYLLLVGWLARRDRRPPRALVALVIAGLGALTPIGTSLFQSFDDAQTRYAILALVESLALTAGGFALRWRVLVVVGVAGTVGVVLRQLVDIVLLLPGWAILGGAGLLLLAFAFGLLLARARLTAAGRAAADRWSGWD
ncbi:MAG: hypothetical protein IT305_04885 [Chloroflexi bacterium]|nr:hypothetical protein [Chloroflexota bacterium]